MEPEGDNLSAARLAAVRPDRVALYDAWRRRSWAGGWRAADDWDDEAVNAVIDAVIKDACGGGNDRGGNDRGGNGGNDGRRGNGNRDGEKGDRGGALAAACGQLGRSRAQAGVGIAETIDDLAALFAALEADQAGHTGRAGLSQLDVPGRADGPGQMSGGLPLPLALICSVAEGWAEEGMAQLSRGSCVDPLSGLATVPYLRTRLDEVYREATQRGTSPADTHRLLVVSLPRRPDPWRRMALAIGVGHDLRAAFPGGETISLARANGTGPALALVRVRADLPMRYARLRRKINATFGVEIRMMRLPDALAGALRLVGELPP